MGRLNVTTLSSLILIHFKVRSNSFSMFKANVSYQKAADLNSSDKIRREGSHVILTILPNEPHREKTCLCHMFSLLVY